MAKLTNLIQKQKSKNNQIGSLQDLLFNSEIVIGTQKKLANNLLTSFKGYEEKATKSLSPVSEKEETQKKFDDKISAKINQIDIGIKKVSKDTIALPKIAKNTMAITAMAKDANITRQSVVKMVKLLGAKQPTKADVFFKTAGEKEKEYESKFPKETKKELSPTPEKEKQKSKGLFGGILSSITDFLPSLFKGLLVGGLIAVAVGQLAKDPAMMQAMKDMVTLIFQSMKDGFKAIGEILKDPGVQEAIRGAIGAFFSMLGDLLSVKLFGNVSLGTALIGLIATIGALKLAMAALSAYIMKNVIMGGRGLGGGLPGVPGGPAGPVGKKGVPAAGKPGILGRVGSFLGVAGVGAGLIGAGKMLSGDGGEGAQTEPGGASSGPSYGNIALQTGFAGVAAIDAASRVGTIMERGEKVTRGAKTAGTAIKRLPKDSMLKNFMEFAQKAVSKGWMSKIAGKLGARLGTKIATRAVTFLAGLAVPGVGWLASAVSLALLALDAYIIYDAIFGANGILEELEKEDTTAPKAPPAETQDGEGKAQPIIIKPSEIDGEAIQARLRGERGGLVSGITGEAAPTVPPTPTPAAKPKPAQPKSAFAQEVDAMASAGQEYWTGGKPSKPSPATTMPSATPSPTVSTGTISSGGATGLSSAADYIAKHEGFVSKAMPDPSGQSDTYSVGFGHLIQANEVQQGFIDIGNGEKVTVSGRGGKDTTITKDQAVKLLSVDLPKYEKRAAGPLGEAWNKLNDNQKTALISYAYNTGSTQSLVNAGLKDAIMAGNMEQASKIIAEKGIRTARGQVLPGLVSRRADEAKMFASDGTSPSMAGGSSGAASGSTPSMTATSSSPSVESTPSTSQRGQVIGASSMEVADARNTNAPVVVNNNTTNNTTNGGGGSPQQVARASGVADPDFAELLFQRAGGFMGA